MCPTFLHRHEIKNVIVIYEMMLVMRVETAVEVAVVIVAWRWMAVRL